MTVREQPRRAVVLGGGGVLGFAWMLGAMSAVEQVTGIDLRSTDIVVGTSAGAVAAALLACGLPVEVMCRNHQGVLGPADPTITYDFDGGVGPARPTRPLIRVGSPRLLWEAMRHPRDASLLVTLSAMLPTGTGSLAPVHDLVAEVAAGAGFADRWPDAPRPWVVAVDYHAGRRVVFGRDPATAAARDARVADRQAGLAEAVTASCSIPAWYPPQVIDGLPYIDGGAISNASVDLLDGAGVDEVFVLAPMASVDSDRPKALVARAERAVRRALTRGILSDVARLRGAGVRVCVLTPGAADLEVMGVNLMRPHRRVDVLETARGTTAAQLQRQLRFGARWLAGEADRGRHASPESG
jgi:NTE family protein